MIALALENVCGGYGRTEVLRNVTLAVGEGEIVTILGANGAGKSTLLNSILGLLARKTDGLRSTDAALASCAPRRLFARVSASYRNGVSCSGR